ncbi:hypothetical protein SEVIR_2G402701v4 [Setaria viridis]
MQNQSNGTIAPFIVGVRGLITLLLRRPAPGDALLHSWSARPRFAGEHVAGTVAGTAGTFEGGDAHDNADTKGELGGAAVDGIAVAVAALAKTRRLVRTICGSVIQREREMGKEQKLHWCAEREQRK